MIEPTTVLKGKIIKILDDYRVVVDIGYEKGIKTDMKFFIFEYGEEIRDPSTGEIIDRIERIKHRIRVSHIQERFSIMRTDEVYRPFPRKFLLGYNPAAYEPVPFTTDPTSIKPPRYLYKLIKIGDLVRQDIT